MQSDRQSGFLRRLAAAQCLLRSGLAGVLLLSGCAASWSGIPAQRELLQPWIEIAGGQMNMLSGAFGSDYVVLRRPVAISASGNNLYLVDAGLQRIFRYDRARQILTPFAANLPVEAGMSIYAAQNQTVYISSPSTGKVLHFTWDGTVLPSLASPGNLARPTSVAVDERYGRILVVDGLYNHIVVFNDAGGVLFIIKPHQLQSISTIAMGPEGIYAIDGLAKRVAVIGRNGALGHIFVADFPSNPGSIVVSRDGLVFVGDSFDNTVRVFSAMSPGRGKLVGQIGGVDVFNGIGGLAVQDNMLYVADSLNGRIQVFLIDPGATRTGR